MNPKIYRNPDNNDEVTMLGSLPEFRYKTNEEIKIILEKLCEIFGVKNAEVRVWRDKDKEISGV